jgi:hypothetical protein
LREFLDSLSKLIEVRDPKSRMLGRTGVMDQAAEPAPEVAGQPQAEEQYHCSDAARDLPEPKSRHEELLAELAETQARVDVLELGGSLANPTRRSTQESRPEKAQALIQPPPAPSAENAKQGIALESLLSERNQAVAERDRAVQQHQVVCIQQEAWNAALSAVGLNNPSVLHQLSELLAPLRGDVQQQVKQQGEALALQLLQQKQAEDEAAEVAKQAAYKPPHWAKRLPHLKQKEVEAFELTDIMIGDNPPSDYRAPRALFKGMEEGILGKLKRYGMTTPDLPFAVEIAYTAHTSDIPLAEFLEAHCGGLDGLADKAREERLKWEAARKGKAKVVPDKAASDSSSEEEPDVDGDVDMKPVSDDADEVPAPDPAGPSNHRLAAKLREARVKRDQLAQQVATAGETQLCDSLGYSDKEVKEIRLRLDGKWKAVKKDFGLSRTSTREHIIKWERMVCREFKSATVQDDTWKRYPALMESVIDTFDPQMKHDFLEENDERKSKQRKELQDEGWHAILQWVHDYTAPQVRDDVVEARTHLLEGKCRQGRKSVTEYLLDLRQYTKRIPGTTDSDMIMWFMHGISDDLRHLCQSDSRGKPWKTFQDLVDHATCKDLELRSRNMAEKKYNTWDKNKRFKSGSRPDKQPRLAAMRAQEEEKPWFEVRKRRDRPSSGGDKPNKAGSKPSKARRAEEDVHAKTPLDPAKVKALHWALDECFGDKCFVNPHICSGQAVWVFDNKRCISCGFRKSECLARASGGKCVHRDKPLELGWLEKLGMPKWPESKK